MWCYVQYFRMVGKVCVIGGGPSGLGVLCWFAKLKREGKVRIRKTQLLSSILPFWISYCIYLCISCYAFLSVFVFVSAPLHFSLYQPFCISLCICLCISPTAFLSVFVFVFAPLVCQAQERRLGENTENPTPFLLFLCISLVSVFVFALLVCAAEGQSNQRIWQPVSYSPPSICFWMGEEVWASGSAVSVLCPISIQNVLALLIFGLGWGESTITIPQSLKVKLSIQGSWHEDEMEKHTDTACPLGVITLLLLLKPRLKPRCHILSQMCHFGQDLQQLNAMLAYVKGMVLSIL